MNRIIPNMNQSIFKTNNESPKKNKSHSVQRRKQIQNKKLDEQSSIILKLLV